MPIPDRQKQLKVQTPWRVENFKTPQSPHQTQYLQIQPANRDTPLSRGPHPNADEVHHHGNRWSRQSQAVLPAGFAKEGLTVRHSFVILSASTGGLRKVVSYSSLFLCLLFCYGLVVLMLAAWLLG